jgi:sensor histidine kinase YesM
VGLRPDGAAEGARSGGGGGVGIANARARLERMYGAAARVSVHDAPDGPGVVAEITLPLRRAASTGVEPQPLAGAVPA